MPTVIIPPPYRGPTSGEAEVAVEAATVREAIAAVDTRYPGFRDQIFDAKGAVHRFNKLFVNGDLLDPQGLDQPLGEADAVEVIAAIAGG